MKLKIKKLSFDAAHYLPGITKCNQIHGHTYVLENIEVEVEENKFVDFRKIKDALSHLDHLLIVPENEINIWYELKKIIEERTSAKVMLWAVRGNPTVENISEWLRHYILDSLLGKVDGVIDIHFELYEGLNQGREI